MFCCKKLDKNGNWDSISLYDENGSSRGEAKFSSKQKAQKYLERRLKLADKAKNREKYQIFKLDNKAINGINKKKYGGASYRLSSPS
jgi:hypothetical protein